MQRACSLRLLGRTSTVLAYQLPGVAGSVVGPVEVSAVDPEQARVGQDRQCDDGWSCTGTDRPVHFPRILTRPCTNMPWSQSSLGPSH